MRLVFGIVACAALFFGVLWAGTKVFAGDETPAQAAVAPSTTAAAEAKQRDDDPHAPREQHVPEDMRLAERAVLHAADVETGWLPLHLSDDPGPGCPANDPDLSRFTVTGRAQSAFKTSGGARMESRVKLFANGGQAAMYFEATSNRTVLHCIRDGIKGWLRENGWKPRVLYARLQTEPPIGAKTAVYLVDYVLTMSDGTRQEYPVDVLTFQVGRAVGTVSFNFIASPDGSRPCECELDEARLVSSRLYRT